MALHALWDVTQQFNNKNGSILTSGKIYIYYKGRTALATSYHDEEGTIVNSNPVLLDNNGRATAFVNPIYAYTIVVCDYYGKELFSQDITLPDTISTTEDVVIIGTDESVLVDTTHLPNGVQYDLSVNTDIIASKHAVEEVKDDLDDLTVTVNYHTTQIDALQDDLEHALDNKKDKQNDLEFNGAATKTVKKITQNANGEMDVEFEDIDLVPNANITSEDNSVQVTETTDVHTKTFDLSVNTDIIATKSSVDEVKDDLDDLTVTVNHQIDALQDDVEDLEDALANKKDKQTAYSNAGSVTKTITSVNQNANGEISVTYSNIALPPDVNITSPNGTINVQSSTNVQTNTKTFTIDNNPQYFIGFRSIDRNEYRASWSAASKFPVYVNSWSEHTYDGDFITNNWQASNNTEFRVKPGLYMVHAVIYYRMTAESAVQSDTFNKDKYMRVQTGYRNGLEDGARYIDWTHAYQLDTNTIQVNFIRRVTGSSNNTIEIGPEFPYGVNYAYLHEFQIVKLS